MSKFNLEAAKRGDVVQARLFGKWRDVYFLGVSSTDMHVVFETIDNEHPVEFGDRLFYRYVDDKNLRMKPKKRAKEPKCGK